MEPDSEEWEVCDDAGPGEPITSASQRQPPRQLRLKPRPAQGSLPHHSVELSSPSNCSAASGVPSESSSDWQQVYTPPHTQPACCREAAASTPNPSPPGDCPISPPDAPETPAKRQIAADDRPSPIDSPSPQALHAVPPAAPEDASCAAERQVHTMQLAPSDAKHLFSLIAVFWAVVLALLCAVPFIAHNHAATALAALPGSWWGCLGSRSHPFQHLKGAASEVMTTPALHVPTTPAQVAIEEWSGVLATAGERLRAVERPGSDSLLMEALQDLQFMLSQLQGSHVLQVHRALDSVRAAQALLRSEVATIDDLAYATLDQCQTNPRLDQIADKHRNKLALGAKSLAESIQQVRSTLQSLNAASQAASSRFTHVVTWTLAERHASRLASLPHLAAVARERLVLSAQNLAWLAEKSSSRISERLARSRRRAVGAWSCVSSRVQAWVAPQLQKPLSAGINAAQALMRGPVKLWTQQLQSQVLRASSMSSAGLRRMLPSVPLPALPALGPRFNTTLLWRKMGFLPGVTSRAPVPENISAADNEHAKSTGDAQLFLETPTAQCMTDLNCAQARDDLWPRADRRDWLQQPAASDDGVLSLLAEVPQALTAISDQVQKHLEPLFQAHHQLDLLLV